VYDNRVTENPIPVLILFTTFAIIFNQNINSMKKMLFSFLAIIILAGCEKEETPLLPCEVDNFGSMEFTNSKSEAYNLYMDGAFQKTIQAGETATLLKVPARTFAWEAKEVNFLIDQDIRSGTVEVEQCKHRIVSF